MKAKPHPADTFSRRLLARYPAAQDEAAAFRRENGDMFPGWCWLPMAAVHSIVTPRVHLPPDHVSDLGDLTAALIWQAGKMIYRFDATLAETLSGQPLDGDIPAELLHRLPYPCVFVELKTLVYDDFCATGFFAWLEYDVNEKWMELRLHFLDGAGKSVSVPLPLVGGSLDDAEKALLASVVARRPGHRLLENLLTGAKLRTEAVTGAINLLLYLCSDGADIPDDTELRKRRSKTPEGNPKRQAVWEIGTRMGAALRKAYSASEGEPSAPGSHASPRAHMRRGHWHHYWTGPQDGARALILKWLPPVAVNIGSGELPAVITPVK